MTTAILSQETIKDLLAKFNEEYKLFKIEPRNYELTPNMSGRSFRVKGQETVVNPDIKIPQDFFDIVCSISPEHKDIAVFVSAGFGGFCPIYEIIEYDSTPEEHAVGERNFKVLFAWRDTNIEVDQKQCFLDIFYGKENVNKLKNWNLEFVECERFESFYYY